MLVTSKKKKNVPFFIRWNENQKRFVCNKHTAHLIGHVDLGNPWLNTAALKKYQMNFLDIL